MTATNTLVFLPGLLCDDALWRRQAEALTDVATSIIVDLTQDDSVVTMARRVLDATPARFSLAGLSMGGYVAFEILRQAPERVTRLALLDTSAAPDDARRIAERHAGIESLKIGKFAGVTNRLLPRLIHPSHVGDAIGDAVKAMAARVGGEAYLRQQQAILGRPDSRALLSQITVPTLVGVGDSDIMTPPTEAVAMHQAIAGSRFHVFADCGHLPAFESPDETSRVLREWLDM